VDLIARQGKIRNLSPLDRLITWEELPCHPEPADLPLAPMKLATTSTANSTAAPLMD